MENTHPLPSGKTSPERSQAPMAKTSDASSKNSSKSQRMASYLSIDLRMVSGSTPEKSWQTIAVSHGESLTRNTGESPSVARESTLSQILEANAPEKYYLSAKACAGILRRAEKRGKELPTMLREALEEVIALNA